MVKKKLTEEQLNDNYDHISTLRGMQAVRKRPGMYIGSTQSLDGANPKGLTQIAQEILSNAIDEAYAGFGNKITMTIHKDNSMTVQDEGRGVPTGGKSLQDAIDAFTKLHSSGKFDASNYANSLGMNGVGATATNALSKFMIVEAITTKKEKYRLEFRENTNNAKTSVTADGVKTIKKEILPYKSGEHTGTKVTFLPDDTIYDVINWDDKPLVNKLEQSAFLTPNVKFIFIDERKEPVEGDEKHKHYYREWLSKNGMPDYVNYIAKDEELVKGLKKPISFKGNYVTAKDDSIDVEGALIYTESSGETILSFANGGPTVDGGPHVDGAEQAIYKAFSDYGKKKKLFKKNQTIDSSDTRDGLIIALLVKLPENILTFESQSKTKLATVAAKDAVKEVVYDNLTKWLYDNERAAKQIILNMIDSKNAREAAIKAKKAARDARKTKNGGGKLIVSEKLHPASSKDAEHKSLFLFEGQSAESEFTESRDAKYQASFPLRGKVLNTENEKLVRVLKNVEITTIASVLGAGIGPAFNEKDLDYNKIIIASDQDSDGYHIANLLTTLFYKFFPGLIENGHLYKVNTPLYETIMYNSKTKDEITELAYSETEHPDFVEKINKLKEKGYKIKSEARYKGLGSLNKEKTKKYIADPSSRKLMKYRIEDAKAATEALSLWMGKDAAGRKEHIMDEIDFDKIEAD